MPEFSRDSRPAQPIDSTLLSTVIALPALSESEHGDRVKEAPDTPQRKCCTNGSRPPSTSEGTNGGHDVLPDEREGAQHLLVVTGDVAHHDLLKAQCAVVPE